MTSTRRSGGYAERPCPKKAHGIRAHLSRVGLLDAPTEDAGFDALVAEIERVKQLTHANGI